MRIIAWQERWGSRLFGRLLLGAVLVSGQVSVAHAVERVPGERIIETGTEWQNFNRTLDGQRFSPLDRIGVGNASTLEPVCRVEVAHGGSFQAGPLVIDDTLYLTVENDTIAVDPVTCAIRWRDSYRPDQPLPLAVNRGVAYFNGRLFRGTGDAHLLAIDAASGKEIWNDAVGDSRVGEFIPGAPVAWNGMVIVGTAASEFGVRGRVLAFDAQSGRELWRFNLVPSEGEPGAETWKGSEWPAHGGGATWSTFTLDPVEHEVFVPTANPVPDFAPQDRPGSNLYTDSVVVLDTQSGALKWWYQLVPHDVIVWYVAAAPLLFRDALDRPRVAAAGKDGYLYVIDRMTHELAFKAATTTVDAAQRPASAAGDRVCPGAYGGTEWNGPAYDPGAHLLFTGAVDYCSVMFTKSGDRYRAGNTAFGGGYRNTADTPRGWISAFDAQSGAVKWKYHADSPVLAALTPTAGGILLTGDNDGNFLVFESATGKLLKRHATGGSIAGGIVTYLANDRQYIAVTSGNLSRSAMGAVGRPTLFIFQAHSAGSTLDTGNDINRGQELYLQRCAACHAADGSGIDGFDVGHIRTRMNPRQLIGWIRNPRPPMPKVFPEKLDAQDVEDLNAIAAYLESR